MKKLAIIPGSYNPFTIGHLNIVEKAEAIFGKGNVLICFGVNPSKVEPSKLDEYLSKIKDKAEKLKSIINTPTEVYSTFLHEFIESKERDGYDVVVVRGLRNGDDLDYEENQLKFIKDFKSDIKVIFIRCDEEYEHISSTAVRSMEDFRKGSGAKYFIV